MTEEMTKAIDTVLGKNTTEYKQTYRPDYLVPIKRQDNRDSLDIKEGELPFTGFDVWHDYEASFLCKGYPISGILKIVIPASSEFTVESKSLKLYLFSFVMQEMAETSGDAPQSRAITAYESTVREDLSKLVRAPVAVAFHKTSAITRIANPLKYMKPDYVPVVLEENILDTRRLAGAVYQENPDLLEIASKEYDTQQGQDFMSDELKSNCKVTHQPDWGRIYVHIRGGHKVDMISLYRYIVSFRGENHFHEEIVECIYQRLMDRCKPVELDVMAFYTRRGGIDICPMRSNRDDNTFAAFANPGIADYRAVRS